MRVTMLFLVVSVLFSHSFLAGVGIELVNRARQEKTHRHSFQVEVPLFTNDDLSQIRNSRVSFGTDPSEAIKRPKTLLNADANPVEVERNNSLHLLKERLRSTRGKLVAIVNLLHVLRLRHNHLRNLYLNASDEIQRMRLEADLRELLEELKSAELEEEKARHDWRIAQSEASKLGLPQEEEPSKAESITDLSTTLRNMR